MSKKKKIFFWVTGTLFVLLLAALLVLPKVIELEPIKERLLAAASEEVGGKIECGRLDLAFLPRPRVVIQRGTLFIPDTVSGELGSLAVYPEILPLFLARLRLAQVEIESPVFSIYTKKAEKETETAEEIPKPLTPAVVMEELAPVLSTLESHAPSLVVRMEDGHLDFSGANQATVRFEDIEVRLDLPSRQIGIAASGFRFQTSSGKNVQAKVQDTPSQITPHEGSKTLDIRTSTFKTSLHMEEDRIAVTIAELGLDHPQINLSGTFVMDHNSPPMRLELDGKGVDIRSTGEVALAVLGDDPTVRDIFAILRAGTVSQITFSSHGTSLDDLDETENMVIKGNLTEAKVSPPVEGVNLDLEDVSGDALISKGILHGKNLKARLGKTQAMEGTLKLGLEDEDAPFQLDILVDADMAQVPPILRQLIEDKDFKREMELIDNPEGRATGRLVLGESLASIGARVDVSQFTLSAEYKRAPFPVYVKGGEFSYDDTGIQVKDLSVNLGQSSFSNLSAELDMKEEPHLEAELGHSEISLDEMVPWVLSFRTEGSLEQEFKSTSGTLVFSSAHLEGPLLDPEKWHSQAKGEVRQFGLGSPLLPWPVKIHSGKFDSVEGPTKQEFSFKDFRTKMLDGSVNVSGNLSDYRKGVNKADLTLQGSLGPKATRWVSDLAHLPPELTIRSPFSISQGRFEWEKDAKVSFAGNIEVQNGPKVSIDMLQDSEKLVINELLVQDEESRASQDLTLQNKEFSLGFSGHLTERTMDRLFEQNQIKVGWLKGNLQVHVVMGRPLSFVAKGELLGKDVVLPLGLKGPTRLESISLAANDHEIKVDSAVGIVGENRCSLTGSVSSSSAGLLIDMDISTDALDWKNIEKLLAKDGKEEQGQQSEDSWDLPVRGTLRLKSQEFTYEDFTWTPVHADIEFHQDRVDVGVKEAKLCGISTPGVLGVTPLGLTFDFKPVAKDQQLQPTLQCMFGEEREVTGMFDLAGEIRGQGEGESLVKSLQGSLEYSGRDGRIYRHIVFAKLLAFLNLTEGFKGKVDEFHKEGLAYKSFTSRGIFEDGKLVVEEASLDSPSMKIACHGDIDLANEKLDLKVLAAPFAAIDTVVKHTPVLGKLLGGTLISIPVTVTGDFADPKVTTMDASAVDSGLLGLLKKTVTLPVKIVEPVAAGEEKEQGKKKK
ncbi:MAG: AsmA-like C-terminal domain-containing protein [Deltaproteobacteria bacterium]|nr:MAG: AsmA-like C-terminal domain-containing protein [Deltaproteobacteria bacterium]